jgi:hypothetical protein
VVAESLPGLVKRDAPIQPGALGMEIGSLGLSPAQGVSADGRVIIGYGVDPNGETQGWIATFPVNPVLQVTPSTNIVASGTQGGPFSPTSFRYELSATYGSVKYSITTPSWLTASSKSGTVTKSAKTITFEINSSADKLPPSTYVNSISFNNTTNNQGNTTRLATLSVNPKQLKITVEASPKADGTVSGGGTFTQGSSNMNLQDALELLPAQHRHGRPDAASDGVPRRKGGPFEPPPWKPAGRDALDFQSPTKLASFGHSNMQMPFNRPPYAPEQPILLLKSKSTVLHKHFFRASHQRRLVLQHFHVYSPVGTTMAF